MILAPERIVWSKCPGQRLYSHLRRLTKRVGKPDQALDSFLPTVSHSVVLAPNLGVTRCNDNGKISACWTCGRGFWVWRLRERNYCSGKCRVRHHRAKDYITPRLF